MLIDTIQINNNQVTWEDEFTWQQYEQKVVRCLDGGCNVQFHKKVYGRDMTLNLGWLTKTQKDDLEALRDSDDKEPFQVVLTDGRVFQYVIFQNMQAEPVIHYNEFESGDFFNIKAKLFILG